MSPKRPSMRDTLSRIKAADEQARGEAPAVAPNSPAVPTRATSEAPSKSTTTKYADRPTMTTGINLPVDLHRRLSMVAQERRYQQHGGRGRASISDVIVELVEKHLVEMEKELGLRQQRTD